MRSLVRLAWFALLFASVAAFAQTVPPPQRPFSQLVELWGRQLDRIASRTEQADLLNRFLSQSSSIDCADVSITFMRYLVGRNVLQGQSNPCSVNSREAFPSVQSLKRPW